MTIEEKRNRTHKLLKHYRLIRSACSLQQVQRAEEAAAYSESLMWFNRLMRGKDPDIITEQIQRTSDHTSSILAVVDHAIDGYRKESGLSILAWRRFDVLYSLYLAECRGSVPDLCSKWHCQKSTLYHDLNQAEGSMATFLFPD